MALRSFGLRLSALPGFHGRFWGLKWRLCEIIELLAAILIWLCGSVMHTPSMLLLRWFNVDILIQTAALFSPPSFSFFIWVFFFFHNSSSRLVNPTKLIRNVKCELMGQSCADTKNHYSNYYSNYFISLERRRKRRRWKEKRKTTSFLCLSHSSPPQQTVETEYRQVLIWNELSEEDLVNYSQGNEWFQLFLKIQVNGKMNEWMNIMESETRRMRIQWCDALCP